MSYTYLIGWSNHNKYYYGVRFAKNCNPKELWVSYFTSSKHVKLFREQYGEPNIIEIRKTFLDANSARLWEVKVLKRLNVVMQDKWLNKTDNLSIDPATSNSLTRQKGVSTRKANNSYKNSKLSELNKLKVGNLNPSTRPDVKKKLSEAKRGTNNPMYGKTGSSHPRYGKVGASTGKKWYHDPINSKEIYCFEDEQPLQYLRGRLTRIKKG